MTGFNDEEGWFDPCDSTYQNRLVLDDAVHVIESVKRTPASIAYVTKCGMMMAFGCRSILEARINLPEATCEACKT